MISEEILHEYVEISRLFGACHHRVQGAGGNLSIKEGDEIILKTSGTLLAEATSTSGYGICRISELLQRLYEENEEVTSCVYRGDFGKPPSLECFLHLLPYRTILHLHPTAFLRYLCSKDAHKFVQEQFPGTLFVPYKKPGIHLAKEICKSYQREPVLFLENHGIILCTNEKKSLEPLIQLYTELLLKIEHPYSNIQDEYTCIKKLGDSSILKPCSSIPRDTIPYAFPALTPDQMLFLKEAPYVLYESTTDIQNHTVFLHKQFVYVRGKTLQQCHAIEEILLSYLSILHATKDSYKCLTIEETSELLHCKKEKYRLSIK